MKNMLIDTDVVIEYLRSENKAMTILINFISSITESELFLGAKTERHVRDSELLFAETEMKI